LFYFEKETRKEDYQVAYSFINLMTSVKREDNSRPGELQGTRN